MNRQTGYLFAALLLSGALLGFSTAQASDTAVTRTLQQSLTIPAGGSVAVENLAGHMSVTQGNGPLQITATVVAGGGQAQALANSIKLDVTRSNGQVLVHVHYPVNRYDTYVYNPPNVSTDACILGRLICFNGIGHSEIEYQGRRVRISESSAGGSGALLYVNVAVRLPAHVTASFSNAVGLLETNGLINDLTLGTQGSDIRVQNQQGPLDARSRGGDVNASHVTSQNARIHTDGGDFTGSSLSGNLNLATGGGDLKLNTVAGQLDISSSGGDVRLLGDLGSLQQLSARTGGGNLTVAGNLAALTALNAASGGGDIVFRVSNLSLHLDASSGGGDINVNLPDLRYVSSSSEHFSGDIGKATDTGSLDSGGGDITVTRP